MRASGRNAAGLFTVALLLAAQQSRGDAPVVGGRIFVNSTQDIIATYLGNSATYEDDLYLYSPSNSLGRIFGNHIDPVGSTKDLGSFPLGTELIFDIQVTNTGNTFYSGPAASNPDNHEHARVTYNYAPQTSLVEFEDLLGGPYDYNDLSFSFTNVGAAHPLISFTPSAPSTLYGTAITNGTGADKGTFTGGLDVLTVTGKQGSYTTAQVTGINSGAGIPTDYVAATGFNPASDPEIFALDVLIGGTQATPTQIATLVADINSTNPFGYGSTIASATDPTNAFGTPYNLFLTFDGLTSASNDLGFDLTQDPTFGSTATVVAVALVPEPTSIGIGCAALAALAARRSRR